MRLLILFLAITLSVIQFNFWFGNSGFVSTKRLQDNVAKIEEDNAILKNKNDALSIKVKDLENGLDMIESIARKDLNMQKKGEIFINFAEPDKKVKLDVLKED